MEEKNKDLDRTTEELTWLENLQRNSWEPEVIISGITLAFLFAFPQKIYSFSAMLIQDMGMHFVGAVLVLMYLSAVISVFKIFFVLHLVLRFVWAGLLGLSYAFPDGVINSKLFKIAQGYEYKKPADMVLNMERICSLTFAYPISLVFTILIFTVYLGFLLFLYIWLNIGFAVIYFIFMGSLIIFVVLNLAFKKSKFKSWYARSIMSTVAAIYQSNLGKWFTILYGVGVFFLAAPLIYQDGKDFSLYFNESDLLEKEIIWPTKGFSYSEFHDEDSRYPRAFLPRDVIDRDFLRLGIARYEGDERIIHDLNDYFKKDLDSLNWHNLEDTPDLYRFSINGKVIPAQGWRRSRVQTTDQKVYETILPIEDLEPGVYTLKIEKILINYGLFSNKPEDLLLRSGWDEIDFIRQ